MHTYRLEREQWLPRPVDEVFAFFSRPENLQVITPLARLSHSRESRGTGHGLIDSLPFALALDAYPLDN
jgi:ligand-binding SRPBCC domain-containing protein